MTLGLRKKTLLFVKQRRRRGAHAARAKKSHVLNEVVVARDGLETLDYLFARGAHAGRDPSQLPQVVLLDLKLPKLDGHEVLHQLRAHPATAHLPVVFLISSNWRRFETGGRALAGGLEVV